MATIKPISFKGSPIRWGGKQTQTNASHEIRDFGVGSEDRFGRTQGVSIHTSEIEFTGGYASHDAAIAANGGCRYANGGVSGTYVPAGKYFAVNVQVTRNGVEYGASQPTQYFHTAQARLQWVGQRVAKARKDAAKKVGK